MKYDFCEIFSFNSQFLLCSNWPHRSLMADLCFIYLFICSHKVYIVAFASVPWVTKKALYAFNLQQQFLVVCQVLENKITKMGMT